MKKIIEGFICMLIGYMLMIIPAYAESPISVLETYTNDSDISVYIKGMEIDAGDVSVQIATSEAEKVSMHPITNLDVSMRTLVMIDNSLSISSSNRDKIAEFLQNLISDRLSNEEICIATFSENINMLTEYTREYSDLKQAVDSISYQNQETYLTDVLYELISGEYVQSREDIYHRIIVISDGVDNKSLGYTKDELYSLLNDIKIPIYTIGCVNKKNSGELENMFALSRMTFAGYFLLDEVENTLDITNILRQDCEIVKLLITPPSDLLDGSKKTVKITFSDNSALTTEIVMPQKIYVNIQEELSSADEKIIEEGVEEEPEIETPVEDEENEKDEKSDYYIFIIAGILVTAVITIIIVILIVMRKRKNIEPKFERIDDNLLKELKHTTGSFGEQTEIVGTFQNEQHGDGKTVLIWNQSAAYQVVLTDINSSMKSFQAPLSQAVIIGRKRGESDIVLDYEKTVSGKHCEITVRNNKFFVRDLQSSNGTFLNGSKVLTETEIVSGNILKLGRLEMCFEVR